MVRSLVAGVLAVSGLLTQAGCESCDFNYGAVSLDLTIVLVDEAGDPLPVAEFEARRDAAEIRSCVDLRRDERCTPDKPVSSEPEMASFLLTIYGSAYENGSTAPGRCSQPGIRVTVDIAGCERGEHEVERGSPSTHGEMFSETLVLTCS